MPHARVFDDICHRDHHGVPPRNIYVCGFPCQPFSVLHNKRRLLRDLRAKAFFAISTRCRRVCRHSQSWKMFLASALCWTRFGNICIL
jgi:site-specific DNA-cytosine methylase